jgi:NAD(P)-dependent dehydrogenase (short-subunit alcohol dehydrogenase family)
VTGANRGIGKALVDEALRSGAKRVYAGVRQRFAHPDFRVVPLTLDLTNAAQIRSVAESVDALDILINNAGISVQNDLSDRAALERLLAVNLLGTYDVTQAFLPSVAFAIKLTPHWSGRWDVCPDPGVGNAELYCLRYDRKKPKEQTPSESNSVPQDNSTAASCQVIEQARHKN